jgi:2,3-bisphosphoglycerate-independent phosphoglycerate mutase
MHFMDGRDTPYNAGAGFIRDAERAMAEQGVGKIASVSGRFFAMDRNNNWDRTAKAYLAMTKGIGNQSDNALAAVEESYKKKVFDEEFVPTVITSEGKAGGGYRRW